MNKPQIRFNGFSEEWEKKKLGNEAEIVAGGDIDTNKIKESGKYPVLANALSNEGIVGFYKNSYRIKAPALTVTGRGDIGHPKARYFNFTPVVRLLTLTSGHNIDFLEKAISKLSIVIESTGVPQLTVPQLSSYFIFFPINSEQTKIGNFFKKLDSLLSQEEKKHTKLINMKKALLEKMFPQKEENTPQLRFKGFSEEWEEIPYYDVFNFSVPTNCLSRADLNNEDGKIKNIHYGDVLIKFAELVNIKSDKLPYIADFSVSIENKQLLKNGDIVMADAAEDNTVGKATEITNLTSELVVSGLHTIVSRPIFSFEEGYMGYYLNSFSYRKQLFSLMQGIKVLSISKTNLSKTNVTFPPNKIEQTKIGELFKALDQRISLQQAKIKKLKNMKKALLDKMFV